jgi:sec-independent protein translocase protein TatA
MELVMILLVVFLLFGTRRLADLGKGIGEGIRGFRRGIAGESQDIEATKETPPEPPRQLVGRVATPEELSEASSLSPATIESKQPTAVESSSASTAVESEQPNV